MTTEANQPPEPKPPRISRWPNNLFRFIFFWSLAALWYLTIPDSGWQQWLIYLSGALVALLLVTEMIQAVMGHRTRSECHRLAVAITGFVFVIVICTTDIGLIVRVYLSEDALRRCFEEVEDGEFDHKNRSYVGGFPVLNAYSDGRTSYIATGQEFKFNQGIGYSLSGSRGPTWRHLYGPWYHIEGEPLRTFGSIPLRQGSLGQMMNAMNERLALMEQVAKYKYAAKKPIADPQREQELLDGLEEKGKAHGLFPDTVRRFFTAQIEAAKALQENHFERWDKEGVGPNGPADLVMLRGKIDALNDKLLDALAKYQPVREDCIRRLSSKMIAGEGIDERVRNLAIAPLLK